MAFCTSCGHPNADNNSFCDDCGVALRLRTIDSAISPTTTLAAPLHPARGRDWTVLIGCTLVLLLAGSAACFFLGNESASPANLRAAMDRYILAHPDFARSRYCLGNFPYDKNPVWVSSFDAGTNRWMNALVSAGLYSVAPDATTGGRPPDSGRLSYAKTDAGKSATSSGALCIASGYSVSLVDKIRDVPGTSETVSAQVTLALKNPLPLLSDPLVQRALPGGGRDYVAAVLLASGNQKWQVVSTDGLPAAQGPSASRSAAPLAGENESPDWLQRVMRAFSPNRNPILGKWGVRFMGIPAGTYEFLPDEIRGDVLTGKARYETRGNETIVYPAGQSKGLVVRLIDANTIAIRSGDVELRAERIP